ncbi:lytic polysaccharide monooxygenase [Actinomadura sp. SCN-SB]|uniref:lytic polysaccharide monooxygenase n=1 Tax=Actinomadura sp. SCN-SB TaxID=3373092 RepID=UPI003751231B
MRRSIAYPLAVATAAGSMVVVAGPASAHGYVSSPPSRQALCAQGAVPDCGPIQFEPQSVEGPKGLRNCHANLSRFAVLSDESREWPAKAVGAKVSFRWVLTARHRTSTWEYFVGGTRVAVFDDGNRQPDAVVTHVVDLSGFPGRRTVLAVWNIGDTPMAFYNCVDLNIGGGTESAPPTGPSQRPTATPGTGPAPTQPAPTQPAPTKKPVKGAPWKPGVTYRIGDEVTYGGVRYRCRQAHTTIRSWEPPFTPALWLAL